MRDAMNESAEATLASIVQDERQEAGLKSLSSTLKDRAREFEILQVVVPPFTRTQHYHSIGCTGGIEVSHL